MNFLWLNVHIGITWKQSHLLVSSSFNATPCDYRPSFFRVIAHHIILGLPPILNRKTFDVLPLLSLLVSFHYDSRIIMDFHSYTVILQTGFFYIFLSSCATLNLSGTSCFPCYGRVEFPRMLKLSYSAGPP